jgi:hypothetical protein
MLRIIHICEICPSDYRRTLRGGLLGADSLISPNEDEHDMGMVSGACELVSIQKSMLEPLRHT